MRLPSRVDQGSFDECVRPLIEADQDLSHALLPLLDRHDVTRVIDELPDDKVAEVLDELPSDDATYVLELMDEERVDPVVAAMEAPEGADVKRRLEYPEGSAGRFMSDAFIALPRDAMRPTRCGACRRRATR